MVRKAIFGLASAGLLFSSTVAVAAPASAVDSREGVAVSEAERGGMASLGWVIALLIAIGVGLVIFGDDAEDDTPVSP